MVGHILYIIAFRLGDKVKTLKKSFRRMRQIAYFIIILVLIANDYVLWDKFPSKIIFIPYSIILAVETMACLSRF